MLRKNLVESREKLMSHNWIRIIKKLAGSKAAGNKQTKKLMGRGFVAPSAYDLYK